MPVDLAQYAAKTVKLTIPFDEGELVVSYNPRVITPKVEAEMGDMQSRDVHKLAALLLTEWDLTSGGKPVPLTEKVLREQVPSELLGEVLVKVLEDMRPNPTTAEPSGSF